MIQITHTFSIDERELQFVFVRAGGPGGQNVNKVATAVQLRFDLIHSPSLPDDVKARLRKLAGKRLNTDGELVLEAKRYRTQEQNRLDALQRFSELVRKAAEKPKPRTKTKPTRASREKRIQQKKRRGEVKRTRADKSFE